MAVSFLSNRRPSVRQMAKLTPAERLALYGREAPETGCIVFTGTLFDTGYGSICINYRTLSAHRLAWEIENGPIPNGLSVLHRCDNRACINPAHLFLGTQADNMRDMSEKGRSSRGEKNAKAKLTEAQVRVIREDGRSHRAIAADYGVAKTTVGDIKRGRIWRHA